MSLICYRLLIHEAYFVVACISLNDMV